MYAELLPLVTMLVRAADEVPDEDDVVAGWSAFLLFGLLIVAVAFLGFSLVKRLRNVEKAEAEGLYDPSSKRPEPPAPPTE
jgi:hypothetical protein